MRRDTVNTREVLLRRGVCLEIGTVVWNAMEGIIAVAAGIIASSVALVGFGVDSFVETTSGAVVGWRLRAELVGQLDKEHAEHLERRAGRIADRRTAAPRTSARARSGVTNAHRPAPGPASCRRHRHTTVF